MHKKVVITGIGVLSPIGIGKEAYWESLYQGKTGFRPISIFDTSAFQVKIAGDVLDFDPLSFLGKKGLRDLDRTTQLVCAAAKLAINDGHLGITDENTHHAGVSIGTTFGSLHSVSQFDRTGLIEGPRSVNPSHFPNTVINSPASHVSIRFKIKGFNTTISTGFCAGLDAISYAVDFIKMNRANFVLAGSVEELCEETYLGFHKLGWLSGSDGLEPLCCPFDARRNGIILSEGVALIVLENEKHAIDRGIMPIAQVQGYANAFDPSTDSSFNHAGVGLRSAIMLALKDAALNPQDIDYISACANSTKGLDRMETEVIKEVFGKHALTIPVSSIKSMVGESFSASGALSLVAAIGALQNNFIPPTVNYHMQDEVCNLDYVPNASRQQKVSNVLVTAADPYGHNSAVILSRFIGR
ncbi:MAG TPA: beta-ketoacyl-[acyl-carrier-protein] synthase family protein [Nitrospirota bacterium]|nr:beta-ketoacyl-[acyl-carrier-protein] synthase family protein [Nitrospirota bacterium]